VIAGRLKINRATGEKTFSTILGDEIKSVDIKRSIEK
jgi:hypothetical protein